MDTKIIVLTPVKNEAWILYQFLYVVSLFADCIVIADQYSSDDTKNICNKFEKVHLIENKKEEYDEAERQLLLIRAARDKFPDSRRILLALDADEIISSNSLELKESWDRIRSAPVGTTIYFEKPDILPGVKKCIRHRNDYFPIGYVDDERQHNPKFIHSKRIPSGAPEKKLVIDDIKILHFALSRKNVQSAKHRYYSVIENLNKTNPLHLRRKLYRSFYDEHKWYHLKSNEKINEGWLKEWDDKNLNLRTLEDPEFSWQDYEVVKMFDKFGYKKFYLENIWRFDWEACRQEALRLGKEAPSIKIKKPGFLTRFLLFLLDNGYGIYSKVKTFVVNKPNPI